MSSRHIRRRGRPSLCSPLSSAQRRSRRDKLRGRDGDGCFFCLLALGDDETIEHLEDWAAGGSNALRNLVLAHRECNHDAQGLTVDQKMLRRGDALLAAIAAEQRSAA
jgi:5-methylcytosine-specific restriction endonuclease McrA